jgi:hypothetical protein
LNKPKKDDILEVAAWYIASASLKTADHREVQLHKSISELLFLIGVFLLPHDYLLDLMPSVCKQVLDYAPSCMLL